jgi:hypothetical protein
MSNQKSREQSIWELLQEYKRKFRPVYMSLMIKEFIDITSVEQRDLSYGKAIIPFTDREWYIFKGHLIDGFTKRNFEKFKTTYFRNGPKFQFETECTDNVLEMDWWLTSWAVGLSFFERPGAIMVRDLGEYWIFVLFSHDELVKRSYRHEFDALNALISHLEPPALCR